MPCSAERVHPPAGSEEGPSGSPEEKAPETPRPPGSEEGSERASLLRELDRLRGLLRAREEKQRPRAQGRQGSLVVDLNKEVT